MRTVALGIAALTVAGCNEQPQKPAAPPASPLPIGRFVIVHSPQVERDTVLLDTVTGKSWTQIEFTNLRNHPAAWSPMAHTENDAEMDALRAANPPTDEKKSTVDSVLGKAPDWASGDNNSN